MNKKIIYISLCVGLICFLPIVSFAKENNVAIKINSELARTNRNLFGNNVLSYDDTKDLSDKKTTNYGEGVWDPKWNEVADKVLSFGKDVRMSVLRFPGGCGVHHYDWKKAIGAKRQKFLFGLNEFLSVCRDMNAIPIVTVSDFVGSEQDAADLVEYLNGADAENNKWAKERTKAGIKEPYGVKYFEIGNETYHGDHREIKKVLPEEYARKYLKYYDAMKKVDPAIQLGVVLYTEEWNKRVVESVRDKVDFGIIHTYPSPGGKEIVEKMDPKDIYRITLAKPVVEVEYEYQAVLKLLKEKTGRDIPLAITEYNSGFVQEKPVPYRHALGTALLNAELLRIFMKPENNILMANYWNFVNEYWGMIANGFDGDPKKLYDPYYKRPNYYVFEMYAKHFGDILVEADVKSDSYDVSKYQPLKTLITKIKTGTVLKPNLADGKWEIRKLAGVEAEEKDGVLNVNFIAPKEFNYYHAVKRAKVEANSYYKLSGYIKTENLIDAEGGVSLEVQDGRGWNATRSAMSTEKVTSTKKAVSSPNAVVGDPRLDSRQKLAGMTDGKKGQGLTQKKGTGPDSMEAGPVPFFSDWQYVEVIYDTLPDAKSATVIARRVGEKGTLTGKAYFKDVKLEKFIPSIDTKIPYLSVNASKSSDGNKVYLMVINKNMDEAETATIELKDFTPATEALAGRPAAKANAWILNGPSVDATNEKKHDNVKVRQVEFTIKSAASFQFTFEAHSLTAIELDRA